LSAAPLTSCMTTSSAAPSCTPGLACFSFRMPVYPSVCSQYPNSLRMPSPIGRPVLRSTHLLRSAHHSFAGSNLIDAVTYQTRFAEPEPPVVDLRPEQRNQWNGHTRSTYPRPDVPAVACCISPWPGDWSEADLYTYVQQSERQKHLPSGHLKTTIRISPRDRNVYEALVACPGLDDHHSVIGPIASELVESLRKFYREVEFTIVLLGREDYEKRLKDPVPPVISRSPPTVAGSVATDHGIPPSAGPVYLSLSPWPPWWADVRPQSWINTVLQAPDCTAALHQSRECTSC